MESHTVTLEDIRDHLTLTDAEDGAQWPEPTIELDVRWLPAEPDVGIFTDTPEITSTTYWFEGEQFTDEDAFLAVLMERIGPWIEEGPDEVLQMIRNRIENAEADMES